MTTVLHVLGTTIAVPDQLAADCTHLPRTDAAPAATVAPAPTPVALAELTALAVEHSPLLCVHAGVVSGPDGLIVIPGPSGLGKTTLVAALVRAGFGYVSDEALALDRDTGQVTAFARPLALGHEAWPLVADGLGQSPAPGTEQLVEPGQLGRVDIAGGRVHDLLLVNRRPGPAHLEPTTQGEAVPALLARAFNHYRAPEASFRAVVALVRKSRVWHGTYADARELAALLADRFSGWARNPDQLDSTARK